MRKDLLIVVPKVPLYDSYVIFNAVQRRDFGGRDLTASSSTICSGGDSYGAIRQVPRLTLASSSSESSGTKKRWQMRCAASGSCFLLFHTLASRHRACKTPPRRWRKFPTIVLQVWWTQLRTVKVPATASCSESAYPFIVRSGCAGLRTQK